LTSSTWASTIDSTETIEFNVEGAYSTLNLTSNCSATLFITIWKDNVKLQSFTIPPDQVVTKRLYQGWYWIEVNTCQPPTESRAPSKTKGVWQKSTVIFKKNAVSLHLLDDINIVLQCLITA